jgi:hypothetical protein
MVVIGGGIGGSIGGGVPSIGSDIRLRDVVISQSFLQYGGVVQYGFGKADTTHDELAQCFAGSAT